jgi:hypothetical protein
MGVYARHQLIIVWVVIILLRRILEYGENGMLGCEIKPFIFLYFSYHIRDWGIDETALRS